MAMLPTDPTFYAQMVARLAQGPIAHEHLEPMQIFRQPSVYDWHKPNEHSGDYFFVRPDPYEWFDPIEGRALPERSPPLGDMADAILYSFSVKPTHLWSDNAPAR